MRLMEAEAVVSEEINDDLKLRLEKHRTNVDVPERRTLDDFDDAEWHVAHIRDMDFGQRRSGCKEETFAEKVMRYRKSLQNDGALVEYVSAQQLPVDEEDLEVDVCRIPADIETVFKPSVVKNTTIDINNKKKVGEGSDNTTVITEDKKSANVSKKEKVDTATTHDGKAKPDKEPKRRSEYMFSSVEYYDDVIDFDATVCHDDVEVITLEVEHIRDYDLQCQLLVEWLSLE
ncbi:unnamed protein product [Diatraea saccharalis]|uniref:Uncharacterized protein n=1 Tax=Diatraea saccharalis TaxID=40085 RepID=A0A9N9W514_9NEOP|nr:unnamed protein product [Diatraea saccharalis]